MAKKKKSAVKKIDDETKAAIERSAADIAGLEDPAGAVSAFWNAAGELKGCETELIEAISRNRIPKVLEFLYLLAADSPDGRKPDKNLVKAIKKAVYRLESAGLSADEKLRPKKESMIRPEPEKHPLGYLSAMDGSAVFVGVLGVPGLSSGYDAAIFMANHVEGLLDFSAGSFTAGELNRVVKELSQNLSGLYEAPVENVRFILTEAAAASLKSGRPETDDYLNFMSLTAGVPLPEKPGIYGYISRDESAVDIDWAESLRDIVDEDVMLGLLFLDELLPYLRKIEDIEQSVLVLTDEQKQEQVEEIIREAELEAVSDKNKQALKKQLEYAAFLFWISGKEKEAKVALAAALDLDREATEGNPHKIISVISRRFLYMVDDSGSGDEIESPDEDDPVITDSGIILP